LNTTIYLAGGCFWCTEAVFQRIDGVLEVVPGYIGGTIKNPAYREVCTGRTGHTEAIQVVFEETKIALTQLLFIFFNTHDPTTLNRQGNDVGTQYRSGVYYTKPEQKTVIESLIKQLETANVFSDSIVTEVMEATAFYKAEGEHYDYYNQNKEQSYCDFVITPKIQKLETYFKDYIK